MGMAEDRAERLVWMDLEMTGLDPERCVIVEIATLVTDAQLEIVAEGPNLVVHQPEEELAKMDDFVVQMHTRSGLIDRIRASTVSLEQAQAQTLAFLTEQIEPRTAPLCGNSIWKDRQFVERYLPEVDALLHYRNVDVSTLKELCRRWYPDRYQPPAKKESHRALDDIRESIAELRYYRQSFMVG
jgi:oligoribonuclease